mmetsp:Transcript_21842/g.19382  ORF Transcript_21842/g.19382 Transcript_21842/m.19382 type:complete len:129 (+) Transcript_21842:200-586(+)
MRLCFIDIVAKKHKEGKPVKRDTALYKSLQCIATEHSFFYNFNLEMTKLLLNNSEFKLVKQTHKVYYQNDPIDKNDSLYIILFGKLVLVRQNEENKSKRIIGSYTIGRTVGEEAILDKTITKSKRLES